MSRALGIALGYAVDRALGDPRRWHPVAGFGRAATTLERATYADSRGRGVVHVGLLIGAAVAAGTVVEQRGRTVATAVVTWAVLGGRSLDREAAAVDDLLIEERLADARQRLTHLVGRDTSGLAEGEVARATIESVAENTSDAVVAPLLWGAVAGVPGLLGYRAANTLDAMVGHRSARYERFGWAAARLDDLLNLPASRLTALLAVLLGDDARAAWTVWRRDAGDHPSPNAGPVEAAFAGALGVRLGGTNVYGDRVEHRHVLDGGRAPAQHDISRARALADRVGVAAACVAVLIALRPTRRRRPRR
jgi:adenosylcobinamide-phosphate synthase